MKQIILVEVESKTFPYREFKEVEYTNDWNELINKYHWRFIGVDSENCVVMERNGYINRFKNEVQK